jgi:hypothetical protein
MEAEGSKDWGEPWARTSLLAAPHAGARGLFVGQIEEFRQQYTFRQADQAVQSPLLRVIPSASECRSGVREIRYRQASGLRRTLGETDG